MRELERCEERLRIARRNVAYLEKFVTFYRSVDGLAGMHVNCVRRAMNDAGLDSLDPDVFRAFICSKTHDELMAIPGLGHKGVMRTKEWAGG